MTEEQKFQQYLASLPKAGVDEMVSKRKAGLPPMHQLLAEQEEAEVEEQMAELGLPIPESSPLTSDEVKERLEAWILSRQCDAIRKGVSSEKRKDKVKKFRKLAAKGGVENGNQEI